MPKVIIDTNSDGPAIERNIVNSLIDSLLPRLSLPKGVKVDYYGETNVSHQPGSAVDDQEQIRLTSDGKITVDVNDDYDEDSLISEAIHDLEEFPFWVDPNLQFQLRPIRTKAMMQLTFTYRAPTRTAANRFRNNIKMSATSGRETHLHELEYHVPIPVEFMIMSGIIYKLRETQGGYGDTYGAWLKKHTHAAFTTVTVDGGKHRLVVAERSAAVQGWFESIVTNKPERDDGTGTWTTTFDYYLSYQRIIGWAMEYPIMIHNQLLAPDFHDYEPNYNLDRINARAGYFQKQSFTLERLYGKPNPNIAGVRIPEFDTWLPPMVKGGTVSLLNMMIGVSPDNLNYLMSFDNLGDYSIDPDVYEFLQHEAPWITSKYGSFFQVDVYRNDDLLEDGIFTARVDYDRGLVIESINELDIRSQYHVRLSVVMDYGLLDERARKAMSEHGWATWLLLKDMGNETGTKWGQQPKEPDFVNGPHGPYIPHKVVEDMLNNIQDGIGGKITANENYDLDYSHRHVQFLSILVENRGER